MSPHTVRNQVSPAPHSKTCCHKRYGLTCEQYDALSVETDHRCPICGKHAEECRFGMLQIDHDRSLGYWAVRGLLCGSCNFRIEQVGALSVDAVRRYLDTPWHVRVGRLTDPNPVPTPVIYAIDLDEAMEMLQQAAKAYRNAVSYGGYTLRLQRWRHLRSVVRIAAKSGVRPSQIAKVTSGRITANQVYAYRHFRGQRIA